jgi:RNA polymerase sigma factor (sigma-70 family)
MVGAESLASTTAAPAVVRVAEVPAYDPEFERVYSKYVPLLRRVAMRKFHIPAADVDELVQDVFATYLTHCDRVRELHSYLIGGICNASRQYWREADAQRKVFSDTAQEPAATDDALLASVIQNALMSSALSQLGESCRETLHRFYVNGESAISIAESRNTTPNSIHRLLNYCRGRAREAYRAINEVS